MKKNLLFLGATELLAAMDKQKLSQNDLDEMCGELDKALEQNQKASCIARQHTLNRPERAELERARAGLLVQRCVGTLNLHLMALVCGLHYKPSFELADDIPVEQLPKSAKKILARCEQLFIAPRYPFFKLRFQTDPRWLRVQKWRTGGDERQFFLPEGDGYACSWPLVEGFLSGVDACGMGCVHDAVTSYLSHVECNITKDGRVPKKHQKFSPPLNTPVAPLALFLTTLLDGEGHTALNIIRKHPFIIRALVNYYPEYRQEMCRIFFGLLGDLAAPWLPEGPRFVKLSDKIRALVAEESPIVESLSMNEFSALMGSLGYAVKLSNQDLRFADTPVVVNCDGVQKTTSLFRLYTEITGNVPEALQSKEQSISSNATPAGVERVAAALKRAGRLDMDALLEQKLPLQRVAEALIQRGVARLEGKELVWED